MSFHWKLIKKVFRDLLNDESTEDPIQLSRLIKGAAKELKTEGVTIFARPHPITAEWADINLEIVAPELCVPKSTSNSI